MGGPVSVAEAPQDDVPAGTPDAPQDDPPRIDVLSVLLLHVGDRTFITTGEIFASFPDLEPETEELAQIYTGLGARGIDVVDEIHEELRREDEEQAGRGREEHRPRHTELGRAAVVSRPGVAEQATRAARVVAPRTDRIADLRPERAGESMDPVRMYLKDIGKVPLLTADQEVTLARRLEAGVLAGEKLSREAGLGPEATFGLEAVVTDGELAKKALIEA